jgi:hypothetical protein
MWNIFPLKLLQYLNATRTIEISIKTDEHLVIKQRRNITRAWCAECSKTVRVISPAELGEFAGAVQRQTGGREVHLIETPEGWFVCLNSVGS